MSYLKKIEANYIEAKPGTINDSTNAWDFLPSEAKSFLKSLGMDKSNLTAYVIHGNNKKDEYGLMDNAVVFTLKGRLVSDIDFVALDKLHKMGLNAYINTDSIKFLWKFPKHYNIK